MQVIARGANESVIINGSIKVTILHVSSTVVRLGITSPDEVPPYREITVDVTDDAPVLAALSR